MMEKTFANFLSEQSTQIDDVDKHIEPPILNAVVNTLQTSENGWLDNMSRVDTQG